MALKKTLTTLGTISGIIIVFIVGLYLYKFSHLGLSNNQELWAQFGDFIGGTLNPLLAFFAFLALLITIKFQNDALIQSKEELSLTRKELEKSAKAQKEQSESLELQNKSTERQAFENTFFSLLKETNSLLEKVNIEKNIGLNKSLDELILISNVIERESNHLNFKIKFDDVNKGFLKRYFIMLYQLLKFINDSNIDNKKRYTNIVRSNLDDRILVLLLFNCYIYDYKKYKSYLLEYSFFEHLNINEEFSFGLDDDYSLDLLKYFIQDKYSNKKYFGSNEYICRQIDEKNYTTS